MYEFLSESMLNLFFIFQKNTCIKITLIMIWWVHVHILSTASQHKLAICVHKFTLASLALSNKQNEFDGDLSA